MRGVSYPRCKEKGTPPKTLEYVAAARKESLKRSGCSSRTTKAPPDDIG